MVVADMIFIRYRFKLFSVVCHQVDDAMLAQGPFVLKVYG